MFKDKLVGGINEGRTLSQDDFKHMLTMYYKERGWDHKGVPKKETLERLEVDIQ